MLKGKRHHHVDVVANSKRLYQKDVGFTNSISQYFCLFLHLFFILVLAAYIQWGFGTEAKAHWKTNDVYNAVIQNEKDLNSANTDESRNEIDFMFFRESIPFTNMAVLTPSPLGLFGFIPVVYLGYFKAEMYWKFK